MSAKPREDETPGTNRFRTSRPPTPTPTDRGPAEPGGSADRMRVPRPVLEVRGGMHEPRADPAQPASGRARRRVPRARVASVNSGRLVTVHASGPADPGRPSLPRHPCAPNATRRTPGRPPNRVPARHCSTNSPAAWTTGPNGNVPRWSPGSPPRQGDRAGIPRRRGRRERRRPRHRARRGRDCRRRPDRAGGRRLPAFAPQVAKVLHPDHAAYGRDAEPGLRRRRRHVLLASVSPHPSRRPWHTPPMRR